MLCSAGKITASAIAHSAHSDSQVWGRSDTAAEEYILVGSDLIAVSPPAPNQAEQEFIIL